MGHINQLLFVRQHAERFHGPYLEAGSKDYGNTQDLRSVFTGAGTYLGVDLEEGPGVDVVLDLAGNFGQIDAALGGTRFGTVFCLSLLEHCENPFAAADNLSRLLEPRGMICVSAPFAFKIHGYPNDYWRFTPEGIRRLFPQIEFRCEDGVAATSKRGEFKPLDDRLGRISFSSSTHWREGHFLRGISARSLKLLSKIGIFSWLTGYRYVMAPTDILMIGTRVGCVQRTSV